MAVGNRADRAFDARASARPSRIKARRQVPFPGPRRRPRPARYGGPGVARPRFTETRRIPLPQGPGVSFPALGPPVSLARYHLACGPCDAVLGACHSPKGPWAADWPAGWCASGRAPLCLSLASSACPETCQTPIPTPESPVVGRLRSLTGGAATPSATRSTSESLPPPRSSPQEWEEISAVGVVFDGRDALCGLEAGWGDAVRDASCFARR